MVRAEATGQHREHQRDLGQQDGSNHGMAIDPTRQEANLLPGMSGEGPAVDDAAALRAHPEREGRKPGQHANSLANPPRLTERTRARFTGKRRPTITKICPCGCGEKFKTTIPKQIYLNEAHKKRHYRKTSRHAQGH